MPTYSYRCTQCDNAFDIQQSFTDDALTECPVCGGRLRKVFTSIGVTFNGSGFYRTDSRSESRGRSSAKSGKSTDSGGTKTEKSTSESSSSSSESSSTTKTQEKKAPASAN